MDATRIDAFKNLKILGPRKLKVGNIVRMSKAKHVFDKGYTPNWTTELFKFIMVNIPNPVTYTLQDSEATYNLNAFYEPELKKTSTPYAYLVKEVLQRKGNKVKVH